MRWIRSHVFSLMMIVSCAYGHAYASAFSPETVGIPPTYAARDLCRTADGEIRHYGWDTSGAVRKRVYVSSRDNGRNWITRAADPKGGEAMVKCPWADYWLYFTGSKNVKLVRSKVGPGDKKAEITPLPWRALELRNLIALKGRRRWLAAFSNVACEGEERTRTCYHATVAYSDDDGKTWSRVDLEPVKDVARMTPGDKMPHWFNNGCEPTIVELKDGTILMAVRTSGPHAAFYRSGDGGATWSEAQPDSAFWQANTMPYFFRLRDGRLLFIWNNTQLLPTRDPKLYPELGQGELDGVWETVFSNRDALHAAISEDDGKTWKGFRELALNEIRNAADFRELGNFPNEEHDKSVHQTQGLELPDGKVLLAYGQNKSARRMLIFDPNWLLETSRAEDFRQGLGHISHHLYVRSLSGGWRGWAGHCAWNRVPGALLVRDPDTDDPAEGEPRSVREVLQICRIVDPRLVDDRQGVVWNFPALRRGQVTLDCRVEGEGFRFALADHWINPCDGFNASRTPISFTIDRKLIGPRWHQVTIEWDCDTSQARLLVDGSVERSKAFSGPAPRFGFSYIHLQTLAAGFDAQGAYFRSFKSGPQEISDDKKRSH